MDTIPLPDGVNHVVTFAEYARVGGELDAARLDRDRLAAENAELRKAYEQQYEAMNVLVQDLKQRDATLDALRDLCGPNRTISNSTCMKMVDILYPQPKETTNEEQ